MEPSRGDDFCCRRAQRIVATGGDREYLVSVEACDACRRSWTAHPDGCTPVVASLVYAAATRLLQDSATSTEQSVLSWEARQFAVGRLTVVADAEEPPSWDLDTQPSRDTQAAATRQIAEIERLSRKNTQVIRRTAWAGFRFLRPRLRIALAGRNSRQGLGYQNRDIAQHLPVHHWMVPDVDRAVPCEVSSACQVHYVERNANPAAFGNWLERMDCLLFVENPCFPELPQLAKSMGLSVICVPNWEWLHPALPWLAHVDTMICPTAHTQHMLMQWRKRFGFRWNLHHVRWPVDTRRFPFRQREIGRRFLFVNGFGGTVATNRDGTRLGYRRKGMEVLAAAARRVPEIPILAVSQTDDVPRLPPNVRLEPGPLDQHRLYDAGDVCIQPSHWEGLGLPLLECQAAGMPLLSTNAAPMNEYQPLALIDVERTEVVRLSSERLIPSQRMSPATLAAAMRAVYLKDITAASRHARRFVESQHSWRVRRAELLDLLCGSGR